MTRVDNGMVAGIREVPPGAGINVTRAVYEAHAHPQFNKMASTPVLGSSAGIDFGTSAQPWSNPFSFTKHEDAIAEEEVRELRLH